jgi:hypothetical protein
MAKETGQLSAVHKGAINEVAALSWLLKQGYYAFQSMTFTGPVDMIAYKPGETPILIDVKTATRSTSKGASGKWGSGSRLTDQQVADGVKILYMNPFTNDCAWTLEELNLPD